MNKIKFGVRWDTPNQNDRIKQLANKNLIDYIEVNLHCFFPYRAKELDLQIYAHTSHNALASSSGLYLGNAKLVKEYADHVDSPWIGEHLAWLGFCQKGGSLGYLIQPIFSEEFLEISIKNIKFLQNFYGRKIAIELNHFYTYNSINYKNEIAFISEVAKKSECYIIFDISHWIITNLNLCRKIDYGLMDLDHKRVIEVHVAGIRKSKSSNIWHDSHDNIPNQLVLSLTSEVLNLLLTFKTLKAITLEHHENSSEKDFVRSVELIQGLI